MTRIIIIIIIYNIIIINNINIFFCFGIIDFFINNINKLLIISFLQIKTTKST